MSRKEALERRRAELAAKRANLSQADKKKLKDRIDARKTDPGQTARGNDDTRWPLSFAQQRLWFLEQLSPGNTAYSMPFCFEVKGPLSPSALQQALAAIVARHAVFRTRFPLIEGEPIQEIGQTEPNPLCVIDWRGFDQPDLRDQEQKRIQRREVHHPFNLEKGPLFRAQLWLLDSGTSMIWFNMHHIISDGWSIGVLFGELARLYQAHLHKKAGQTIRLPRLPLQFAEVAAQQRQRLQGPELARLSDYWKKQFEKPVPRLLLPFDLPHPPIQTYTGKDIPFQVSATLIEPLKDLAKSEGATLFMALLAGLKTLLFRYSGQSDLVVGTLIANRNRAETAPLIGFFANTLALRTELSLPPGGQDATFRQILNKVRRTALDAYHHQDLPFEKLIEDLRAPRDLSTTPLLQVLCVLHNTTTTSRPVQTSGLTFRQRAVPFDHARFDLSLSMIENDGLLNGAFNYNTALFHQQTIDAMRQNFCSLLHLLVADPDRPVSEIPLFSEAEEKNIADKRDRLKHAPIALDHLEATLRLHPRVAAVRVLSRNGQIVAYVAGSGLSIALLREYLIDHAPMTALPAAFVIMDKPLSAENDPTTGAYPAPRASDLTWPNTRLGPRSEVELEIAAIWSALLGPREWSVHDNFFEVGGRSLTATKILFPIAQKFGAVLPVREIFLHPTIATLADRITKIQGDRDQLR